jgi:polar amino acid transport system substrate-binding protein
MLGRIVGALLLISSAALLHPGANRSSEPGRTPMKKLLLAAMLALAAIIPARAESALDTAIKRGTIIIGISLANPPFGMTDANMQPAGFDVDLSNTIAHDLGVKVQFMDILPGNRVPFLQQGKVDVVVSSFSVTAERAKVVAFTNPVYMPASAVIAPKSAAISSVADMAGKSIGVTRTTTGDIALTALAPKGTNIQRYEDDASTAQALFSGQVDAIFTATATFPALMQRNPNLALKLTLPSTSPMAIGVRRDDQEMLHWVNTELGLLWMNGDLQKMQAKWFGVANQSMLSY